MCVFVKLRAPRRMADSGGRRACGQPGGRADRRTSQRTLYAIGGHILHTYATGDGRYAGSPTREAGKMNQYLQKQKGVSLARAAQIVS
jgi:hypothetical protein